MSSLDKDFEILNSDYDRLVALESLGVDADYPAVCAIRQRWALDGFVAGESSAMMERARVVSDGAAQGSIPGVYARKAAGVAGRAVGTVAKGAGRVAGRAATAGGSKIAGVTAALAGRFADFASELAKEQAERLKEAISKATLLEKQSQKLLKQLNAQESLDEHPVYAGSWTSKVCLEDKLDVHAAMDYSQHIGPLEAMVQQYTVKTRTLIGKSQKVDAEGLVRLGRSTNWAVKRAAGLLGIVDPFKEIEAYPLPGNIIIAKHHSGKIQWAIGRNGDYGETIPQLSKDECHQALNAANKIIATLRDRGVKRRGVGYSGIYEEVRLMQKELSGLSGKELRDATKRYKNALALEDAFTTSLVRVAEGLLEYVKQSIAKARA